MTKALLIFILSLPFLGLTQTKKVQMAIDSICQYEEAFTDINLSKPKRNKVEIPELNQTRIKELVHYSMFRNVRKKYASTFKTSENLNRMAEVCNTLLNKTKYENKKSWRKLQKYLHRSFRGINSDFSIIKATAFRIPLIKVNGRYHYDKKDDETDLHLFTGKKETLSKKEEEEGKTLKRKPLEPITELELIKLLKRRIYKSLKKKHISNGTFSRIGIHVELDDRTINRKKIPTLKVVIIIGAKKLQGVKNFK